MFFGFMKNLTPKALRKGDTIGLISPSSHCAYPEKIGQAILYLEKNGYKVKPSLHLNRIDPDPAIADKEKLHDIHSMFSDPAVQAIFCVRGGAGAARLLNNIDYSLIAANPKILAGYSDITALSLAIYTKTGLISFSGPMLATELYRPPPIPKSISGECSPHRTMRSRFKTTRAIPLPVSGKERLKASSSEATFQYSPQ